MFAVIYRFKLKPEQEKLYQQCWNKIVDFFIEQRGAMGSCLHKGSDGLWIAYSRWPNKETRDTSWPIENILDVKITDDIHNAFQQIQHIKNANQDLDQYDEIRLEVVEDRLVGLIREN